jgi:hypothetical protein
MFESVPDELKALNQWVTWRYEERNDKQTKVLTVPGTGRRASSTNPNTWRSFADATAASTQIGFVFTPDDPYFGLDLDRVILESGKIHADAQNVLDRFYGAYIERSPSGTGFHIWGRAVVGRGRKTLFIRELDSIIELYDRGRYFTITGDAHTPSCITPLRDYQPAIDDILTTIFKVDPSDVKERVSEGKPWSDIDIIISDNPTPPQHKLKLITHSCPNWTPTWERKRRLPNQGSFSEYDLSLADMMAQYQWTPQEMCDTLCAFRLYHGVDTKLGRVDYYQRTIFKALEAADRNAALENLAGAEGASPDEALAMITHITGLDVQRYVQSGRGPAEYRVHLGDGDVYFIGPAGQARSQAMWQTIAQEKLGTPFERLTVKEWQQVLVCLGGIVEREMIEDSVTLEVILSALQLYTGSAVDDPDYRNIRSAHPFMEGNQLYLNAQHFLRWYRGQRGAQLTDAAFLSILRTIGATVHQIHRKTGNHQATRRYWLVTLEGYS